MDAQLKIEDLREGTGPEAKAGQTVVVHYVGTLTSGQKFDSSRDRGEGFKFSLGAGQVIKGWDQGVAGMKVGGKRTLIIPPDLGYGAGGTVLLTAMVLRGGRTRTGRCPGHRRLLLRDLYAGLVVQPRAHALRARYGRCEGSPAKWSSSGGNRRARLSARSPESSPGVRARFMDLQILRAARIDLSRWRRCGLRLHVCARATVVATAMPTVVLSSAVFVSTGG